MLCSTLLLELCHCSVKLVEIYVIFAQKFLIEEEHWDFVSELVILCLSALLLYINDLQLDVSEVRRQLLQGLVTQLTLLLGEQNQHGQLLGLAITSSQRFRNEA